MAREQTPPLSAFFSSKPVASFLDDDWNRRSVVFRGPAAQLGRLRGAAKWRNAAWLTDIDAATRDAAGVQSQQRVHPENAADHYARGATLCADASREPAVAALLASLRRELGVAGEPFAKLYASPPGAGFAMHFDGHHVFVIQLSGRKRWRFSETPALASPPHSGKAVAGQARWASPREGPVLDDAGRPVPAPSPGEMRDETLEPGDCLYLPPGAWHTTEADRHSVAISVSPAKIPAAHWVLEALGELAESSAACRADVASGNPALGLGTIDAGAEASIRAAIDELRARLNSLDARQIHRAWLSTLKAHDPPREAPSQPLSADTRLRPAAPDALHYLAAPERTGGPDAVHLYGGGAEWTLPAEARAFIDAAASHAAFTVAEAADFDPSLGAEDSAALLQQLVDAGLLTTEP